ncbi:MAG: MarR family winged helix-turn-helix transcriptional regulator [Brevirhabdus sp.]
MSTPADTPALEQLLCFNIYSLNRAFSRFYQAAFSDTGMTYPKFVVLSALAEAGPLSVSALSARVGMEPSTLSPLLKRMADYGTLTRARAPEDERRVVIDLTEMGKQAIALVREVVLDNLEGLGLEPGATTSLVDALDEARAKLDGSEPARKLELGKMPPPLPSC